MMLADARQDAAQDAETRCQARCARLAGPHPPACLPRRCAPAAPSELAAAHGAAGAAALRFVTLLREPIARAASSVRARGRG